MTTNVGDIILDYHLGTGTTCAVAHKMRRRYIGIEQLDYENNDSTIRLQNVINGDQTGISKTVNWKEGGSFVYAEIAQANDIFREKIHKASNTDELLSVWEEMKNIAFLSYKIKPNEIDSSIRSFEQLSLDNQKRLLVETLDMNMLYIPYSEIDDSSYRISDEVKRLNKKFYGNR